MRRIAFLFALWASLAVVAPAVRAQEVSIVNLYDAFGYQKKGTMLDWGYSALIRYKGKTILFDAGLNADTFAHNVSALGVDLTEVDFAVLSHSHVDHLSGFDHLLAVNPSVKLYLPQEGVLGAARKSRVPVPLEGLPEEQVYFRGSKDRFEFNPSGRFWRANAEFIGSSKEIATGVFLIVTESPLVGYFSKYPPHETQPALRGLPELSLALLTERGMVLIVGCSHSRVEAIVKEAKNILQRDVDLLAGGFHLIPYAADYIYDLAATIKEDLGVKQVAPAHCTGHFGFKILKEVYGDDYFYAGLESEVKIPD